MRILNQCHFSLMTPELPSNHRDASSPLGQLFASESHNQRSQSLHSGVIFMGAGKSCLPSKGACD
jgi:hypothetical protein